MKPHDGGGWKNVYKVENVEDLGRNFIEQLVMMLKKKSSLKIITVCIQSGQKYAYYAVCTR
jgi:hypothetical protein